MAVRRFAPTLPMLLLTLVLTLPLAGLAGEDGPTPTALTGGTIISLADAKSLWEGKGAVFFDMRSAVNFGRGHIPGARALPYKQKSAKTVDFDASLDKLDLTQLPADKSARIVFHSDGPTGWKSYKAAVIAIGAGYTKVLWFRGGFAEWEQAGLPIAR